MASVRGGNNIAAKLRAIEQRATSASTVKVGFLAGGTYPDGKSIPMIAAINEFGAPSRGQPPRPFFRRMVADKSPAWPGMLDKLLRATDYDAAMTLGLLGEQIKGELVQSIRDLWDPPLAPSTVARKGFDKPLIETSVMINSVGSEVS